MSAFDVVMDEPIPDKGRVLTAMSAFWFEHLADVARSHLVSTDLADFPATAARPELAPGGSMLCRRAEMLPVECIVRGYLTGSAWKEYRPTGTMHGVAAAGRACRSRQQLPEPVFTPSTKAEIGDHDENISFERRSTSSARRWPSGPATCRSSCYQRGAEWAAERGIIIADTKFELGLIDGELVLCRRGAHARLVPVLAGRPVERRAPRRRAFDKQPVRDYLDALDWDKTPPPPPLPAPRWSAPAAAATSRPTSASPACRFADWPGSS